MGFIINSHTILIMNKAILIQFFIITCKGVYVTTDDILFASMSTEQLWHEAEVAPTNRQVQFEKAIAVEVK